MLILTRRPVETIYIGDEVTVTVLGVVGNQVRFGIEAPRSIVIDRAEIHERKKRSALGAGNLTHGNLAGGNQAGGQPAGGTPPAGAQGAARSGNVLEDDGDIAVDTEANGNVATLKLHR